MSNPFSYENKRVVVTGGATGVGAALLDLLAEIGAPDVTVLDIKAPSGPHARFIETNLSEERSVRDTIAAIDGPVDVLFNNAGVASTQPAPVVLSVNYLALRALSDGLLDRMSSGGAVVNTASLAGMSWQAHLPQILELIAIEGWDASLEWIDANLESLGDSYMFSKEVAWVFGMQRARAYMAKGVRINGVCPSPIDTPLLPDFKATLGEQALDWSIQQATGKPSTPREVAMPLAFLGSDAAAYISGHGLVIDGGFSASLTTGQIDFSALA